MPEPSELSAVVARTSAVRVIEEHAQTLQCRLAVFDTDGTRLAGGDDLGSLELMCDPSGEPHVAAAPGPAALSPIEAFGRRMGSVVAVALGGDSPRVVAERAALVLSDLCTREYELNDLSREILAAYEELNLFYDLADRLAGRPEPDSICSAVLERAMHVIHAQAGRILVTRKWSGDLRVAAARGAPATDLTAKVAAGSAAMRSLQARQAELVEGRAQLTAFSLDDWERGAMRALITVPLYLHGRDELPGLGVMQLRDPESQRGGTVDGASRFTSGDVKLAQALASQAALLIENSRLVGYERELLIARTIQDGLLPADPPEIPGLEIAATCLPAHNVGGDYYDLVRRGESGVDVVLADVSGHHLAAALIQTAARATFRAALLEHAEPRTILARVNRALMDDLTRSELFLTAWYATMDAASGRLVYGDAGHHPALHYSAREGRARALEMGGLPIGVADDGLFCDHETTLEPGDVLVAYTDGLSEAAGPGGVTDPYGDHRVVESLERVARETSSAAEILAGLLEAVDRFSPEAPTDDRTVVVLKRRESESR